MTLRGRGSGWRWGTITPIIPLGEITCQRDLCPFCVGPYLDLSRVGFQQPTTDPCSSDRPQGRLSIAHSRQIRAIYHPDPIGITSFRPGLVKDLISHGRAPSTKGATALPAGLIIVAATSCAISLDTYDTKGRRIACESQFDRDEHTAIPPMVQTVAHRSSCLCRRWATHVRVRRVSRVYPSRPAIPRCFLFLSLFS